jgi:hypothetical protein
MIYSPIRMFERKNHQNQSYGSKDMKVWRLGFKLNSNKLKQGPNCKNLEWDVLQVKSWNIEGSNCKSPRINRKYELFSCWKLQGLSPLFMGRGGLRHTMDSRTGHGDRLDWVAPFGHSGGWELIVTLREGRGDQSEAHHSVEGRRGGVIWLGGDEGRRRCLELGDDTLGAKRGKDWVPNGTGGGSRCS